MKKSILTIVILIILAFNLNACAGTTQSEISQPAPVEDSSNQSAEQAPAEAAQPVEETAPQPADGITLDTSYDNAASEEIQIIVGTINLKDTDLAITPDQAKTLIPLLTEVKTITESMMPVRGVGAPQEGQQEQPEQPSQEEMEKTQEQLKELYQNIKAVFTAEQMQAIADMKITQDTVKTTMEALGIEMHGPQGDGQAPQGDGQVQQGEPPSGGEPPADGGPGEGGQPPADGQAPADGQMMGTPQADGGGMRGGGMMVSSELIDAIITYLEALAVA